MKYLKLISSLICHGLKIEHKQDVVLTDFISNFVIKPIKRMRQYALHTNKNKNKDNAKKVCKISSHITVTMNRVITSLLYCLFAYNYSYINIQKT